MSWDILVQDMPAEAKVVADIPDHFKPKPLGLRSELISRIVALVPEADFSDPSWGLIDGPDFSIEVSLGPQETVSGFSFHVRGGDAAAGLVSEILASLSLRAFDTTTGEFFQPSTAVESLRKWRAYRDRAVGPNGAA
jgi:hypothetical protein